MKFMQDFHQLHRFHRQASPNSCICITGFIAKNVVKNLRELHEAFRPMNVPFVVGEVGEGFHCQTS